MKVAIVAPEFPPELGGMQTYSLEIARELAKQGVSIKVFTSKHHDQFDYDEAFEVLPVLKYRKYHDLGVLRQFQEEFTIWHSMTASYAWMAKYFNPLVVSVHGNDFLNPPAVASLDLRKRLKFPIRSEFELRLARRCTLRLLEKSFPLVQHVFCNSKFTEREFLKRHPACHAKVSSPLVGLADSFFQLPEEPAVRPDVPHLVTVCRLSEPRKNVDRVLHALAKLQGRFSFHYTVVGEGDMRLDLETLTRRLGLNENVTFTGSVGCERLKQILASADLFVLTASASERSVEGFGIVYLEANALAAPVLAARIGGAVEAVQDGVSGYFVDEPSVEQIAIALERFLSKEVAFDRQLCREHAGMYRWEEVVNQMMNVYRQVANFSPTKPNRIAAAGNSES